MGASKWRKVIAAVVAAVAVGGGILAVSGSSPANATSNFQFLRAFNGPNRYDTARLVAVQTFGLSDTVLLATGTNFPDALAASYLAGDLGAPILLTDRDSLPPETAVALQTLKAKNVTILGGTGAVSSTVESQLRSAGLFVDRLQGATRYATALEIAKRPLAHHVGSLFAERTAILASGATFADALAGGPVAYAGGFPILLTPPGSLGHEARQGLAQLGIQRVLLLGGSGAVSAAVEDEVRDLSINVTRIGGVDRTHTAQLLADFAINTQELSFTAAHVNLANGGTGVDALAAGPHGGKERAPILLTPNAQELDTSAAANTNFLYGHSPTLQFGHVFGGSGAIADDVVQRAARAAGALPTEAPSGVTTPTVYLVNVAEQLFVSTDGRTYRYGYPGDTYQIQGSNAGPTELSAVLSPGDVLSVNYNPSHVNPSSFHVTTDVIPEPAITSVTRSGATVNVHFTISPIRSAGTVYVLQRSSSALPGCLGPFGGFQTLTHDAEYDGHIADTPPSGCYQYRILAFVPVAGASSVASAPTGNIQA